MTTRICPVALDQATPGTTLGADIQDGNGLTLLAAGAVLTESHLASLRRRGIAQVPIAVTETLSAEQLAAHRQAARERLQHLFRHPGGGAADEFLQQVLLEYRMEQLR